VFGLLVIIMVYYIVVSKSRNASRLYGNSGNWSASTMPLTNNLNSASASAGASTGTPTTPISTMPVPINSGGYYAAAPVPSATTSGPTQSNSSIKQVFNIKENIYAADDAAGVCGALGADVASLQQLVDAHRQGANWCNVGWTKEGLAAYPIQQDYWQKMQGNDPQNRNICGQPGINLARNDAGLLYGVNCYGVKPEPKNGELVKDVVQNDADIALQAKIAQFQKTVNNMTLAPFNANQWSE
jgi:Extracellular link domain